MRFKRCDILLLLLLINFFPLVLHSESTERWGNDSLLSIMDNTPSFVLFKDNYFITGLSRIKKPLDDNCDVKFQVSFKLRMTKSLYGISMHHLVRLRIITTILPLDWVNMSLKRGSYFLILR